jgi:hypothetical protein
LGKKNDGMIKWLATFPLRIKILVPQFNNDFENWFNDMRERRAGRPQYGILG